MAAALPMIAAEVGAVGFSGYKLVQTSSGGSVGVRFGPTDGKELPPQPLPAIQRVAVWPGDRSEVEFAQKLEQAHDFKVTAPASIVATLADVKLPTDLNQMTDQERDNAFSIVCRRMNVDLIFASRSLGVTKNASTFSLSRPTITGTADLMGYSCAQKQIVWKDRMTLVEEVSDSHIPSESEIATVAGDAWANRILQARYQPVALK